MNPISTYRAFGNPASATVKILRIPEANPKITVDGVDYRFRTEIIGTRNMVEAAESLAAFINADRQKFQVLQTSTQVVRSVYAIQFGSTVVIVASNPGSAGNAIAVTTDDVNTFLLSGATLSGGTDQGIPIELSTTDIEIGAVELKDGTTDTRGKVKTDGTDNALVVFQNVQPLPTGAATEATLSALNAKVTAVNTGAVTVSSSALPTGASTEATLAALNAKVTAVDTGAVTVSSSALPTGAATSALQTQPGIDIGDVTVNNAAGASAVNVQDGGNSLTIDAASLPLPTGAATSALQTQPGVDIGDVTINNAAGASAVNVQDGGNSLTVDAASLPLPTGASTEVTLNSVLAELQASPDVGQATSANSLPVVIANDQSSLPVTPTMGTTLTVGADLVCAVAGTAVQGTSVATTRGVMVVAASQNVGSVYIGGATVTNNSGALRGIELVPGGMIQLLPVSNLDKLYINADNAGDKAGVIIL